MYPFATQEKITATIANLLAETTVKELTAGEAIDASTTPQAVYLKASDGKIWLSDTDADESTFKFVGFVGGSQNVAADASVVVTLGGILAGFTGLTAGDNLYLSATAGTVANSPVANQTKFVALVMSATQIFIVPQDKKVIRTSNSLADGSGNGSDVVTTGFRPRLIFLVLSTTCNDCGSTYSKYGLWVWADGGNAFAIRFSGTGTIKDINSYGDWQGSGFSNLVTTQIFIGKSKNLSTAFS